MCALHANSVGSYRLLAFRSERKIFSKSCKSEREREAETETERKREDLSWTENKPKKERKFYGINVIMGQKKRYMKLRYVH